LKGIVFDLDGTLVRGEQPLPGAVAAVDKLRRDGLRIAYCTQDSLRAPSAIAGLLERLGFVASTDDVISTGWIAAGYLAERYQDAPIYMIGAPELRRAFAARGINIVDDSAVKSARAVFVARDPGFTNVQINAACQAIWNGADFLGVGYDRVLPAAGRNLPGTGAIIKAIEHVTRRRARILGKPSLEIAKAALRQLKAKPDDAVVVGDQVDPDIRMGKSAGCRTVLVLSGGTSAADARRIPARWRPDTILRDVGLLPDWIAKAEA
jgi:HAD superfamily hydrolase (TIGR01450 family)